MNKYILILVCSFVGLLNVHAYTVNQTELFGDLERVANIQGIYNGKATPSMMNGKQATSGKSYNCNYTIDAKGYLSGSFRVGPHDIIMNSLIPVTTSPGGVPVKGNIKLFFVNFPFEGKIYVTSLDGVNLEFSCEAFTKKGAKSKFTFNGKKE